MDFSYTKSNYCFVEKDKISPELSACPLPFPFPFLLGIPLHWEGRGGACKQQGIEIRNVKALFSLMWINVKQFSLFYLKLYLCCGSTPPCW